MQAEIKFDPSVNKFTLGGLVLPRVTEIIDSAGLVDKAWFTDEHRLRGQAVHTAVLYDIQNDLDKSSIHESIAGYLRGWFLFKSETNFKPIVDLCEKRHWHPLYKYTGMVDLFGPLNYYPAIIDIKTGNAPTACYQTAAYAEFPAYKGYMPKRYDLRLFPDGTYTLKWHRKQDDFLTFLSFLKNYR